VIRADNSVTAGHSSFRFAGGLSEIDLHSAALSATTRTSRTSAISSAAPTMRALFSKSLGSVRPEKSKLPPARKNARISDVS